MYSKIEEIEIGVPQGSCLGLLLFLVFISDLPLAIKNSKTSLYFDDTSIYRCSRDMSQLNNAINDDLDRLEDWLKGNKLFLNVAETHSMLIASHNRHNSFMGSSIRFISRLGSNEVEIRKYLEVQIDEKLNWKEHINEISARILRAVGFLKIFKALSSNLSR